MTAGAWIGPKEQFTSLAHLINEEMLLKCHHELDRNKASGIDEVTKADYEENLFENISRLHELTRTPFNF